MSIIANWTAIEGLGATINVSISDYTQCPQKSDILLYSDATITGTYDTDQLVQLADISVSSTPPPSTPYDFVGWAALTGSLPDDKDMSYNSMATGTIYLGEDNIYYSDIELTTYATNGVYTITRGIDGYPTFVDSTFIIWA